MSTPVKTMYAKVGALHMQVCADNDTPDEVILEHCNRVTAYKWSAVHRETGGMWRPMRCGDRRTHLMVSREQQLESDRPMVILPRRHI